MLCNKIEIDESEHFMPAIVKSINKSEHSRKQDWALYSRCF